MNKFILFILTVVIGLGYCSAQNIALPNAEETKATSQETTEEPLDTIYLYPSWNRILEHNPLIAYSGPIVYHNDELVTQVYTMDEKSQKIVNNDMIAMCVGDSDWYVNSRYLKKNFKCDDYDGFEFYLPLYFSQKIAIAEFWDDYSDEGYARNMPLPDGEQGIQYIRMHHSEPHYYVIDFISKRVDKLDWKLLKALLADYPELQRRYLCMKKYKTDEVVRFFFQKYIEALDNDDNAMTIPEQIQKGNAK